MDLQRTMPNQQPDSRVPTLVPSARSVSDDGKASGGPGEQTDADVSSASPVEASAEVQSQNEKQDDSLARQPTSASNTGNKTEGEPAGEDGTTYPTGMKLILIVVALCLAVFVMALDNSIIATAIPKITDQFHSLPDVGWYGSAYLLTTASLQLLFGRFYTFFSIKWVFLTAIVIFEVGSLICGVAQNSVTLIVGRAIAGIGAAGIFSGALTILAYSVPLSKRPLYTGAIGSMYGLASISGPLMGGAFTDRVTWRWCFYINLPIGAVTIFSIAFFFPDPPRQTSTSGLTLRQKISRFDPVGTIVFMPAVICLLLALQWGGTTYDWNNWRIILLFCFAGVLIIFFLVVQYFQQDFATVPPRIFVKRTVWSSSFFIFTLGGAFLGSIYYLPIWFQAVKDASAVGSGIMNLPMLVAVIVASVIAGAAVTFWGYYTPFMILSSVLSAIGYGLTTMWEPDTGSAAWIGYQIIAGAGIGVGFQQPLMAVQTVLNIADVPTGTALVIFSQTLGGALFVAAAQTVFSNALVDYVAEYVPQIENPAMVLAIGATSIQEQLPTEFLPGVIQAFNDSLTDTFVMFAALSAICILGALIVEWKSVKGKQMEMHAA
ncbi:hypothetical protein VTK26DRAFT_2485 [Humicola hyalothermophila]